MAKKNEANVGLPIGLANLLDKQPNWLDFTKSLSFASSVGNNTLDFARQFSIPSMPTGIDLALGSTIRNVEKISFPDFSKSAITSWHENYYNYSSAHRNVQNLILPLAQLAINDKLHKKANPNLAVLGLVDSYTSYLLYKPLVSPAVKSLAGLSKIFEDSGNYNWGTFTSKNSSKPQVKFDLDSTINAITDSLLTITHATESENETIANEVSESINSDTQHIEGVERTVYEWLVSKISSALKAIEENNDDSALYQVINDYLARYKGKHGKILWFFEFIIMMVSVANDATSVDIDVSTNTVEIIDNRTTNNNQHYYQNTIYQTSFYYSTEIKILRENPSTKSEKLVSIPVNTEFEKLDYKNAWIKVSVNINDRIYEGWISNRSIKSKK